MIHKLLVQETNDPVFRIQLQPLFEDSGIPLAIMGMLVVFAALVLVTVFISLLPKVIDALDKYFPEQGEARMAVPSLPVESDLSEEMLVVIAAAVEEAIGEPHRIIRTRELRAEDLAWSLEGRLQHHTSHKTQPRHR